MAHELNRKLLWSLTRLHSELYKLPLLDGAGAYPPAPGPLGANPRPPAPAPAPPSGRPSPARRPAAGTPSWARRRAVPARLPEATAPPSPSPGPPARGPLTARAETKLRLSRTAAQITPFLGPGSGSYPGRTRPTLGWRLSPSSWSFLCTRDRKILGAGVGGRSAPGARGLARRTWHLAGEQPRPQAWGCARRGPGLGPGSAASSPAGIAPLARHRPAPRLPPQTRSSWTLRRREPLRTRPAPAEAGSPAAITASSPGNCTFSRPVCGQSSGK